METLRAIILEKLPEDIEKSIYNHAVLRANGEEGHLLETFYKQNYIKYICNVDKTEIIPNKIVSTNNKLLRPEKWHSISRNRTENNKKILKQGAHKCHNCHSWLTEHTESQRAAADESSTIFVSCLNCGHHFKY